MKNSGDDFWWGHFDSEKCTQQPGLNFRLYLGNNTHIRSLARGGKSGLKNFGEASGSTNRALSWKENSPALVTTLSSSSVTTTELWLTSQVRKKTEMKKELKASAEWEKAVAVIIGPETGSDRALVLGCVRVSWTETLLKARAIQQLLGQWNMAMACLCVGLSVKQHKVSRKHAKPPSWHYLWLRAWIDTTYRVITINIGPELLITLGAWPGPRQTSSDSQSFHCPGRTEFP